MNLRLQSRSVICALALGCATLQGACSPREAPEPASAPPEIQAVTVVPAVLGLTLTVSDLERSERLLQALDFSIGKRTRLASARAIPGDARSNDRSFQHMERWQQPGHGLFLGIEAALARVLEQGGQQLSASVVDVRTLELGYAKAVLVNDRDGHSLRLVAP